MGQQVTRVEKLRRGKATLVKKLAKRNSKKKKKSKTNYNGIEGVDGSSATVSNSDLTSLSSSISHSQIENNDEDKTTVANESEYKYHTLNLVEDEADAEMSDG